MNPEEAKFLLGACRPAGRDAADPRLAEALAAAGRDPALREWLRREQAFDVAMAGKLGRIAPPPGLRETILAGGRASRSPAWWRRNLTWLAMAAAIPLLLALAFFARRGPGPDAGAAAYAALAVGDLLGAHREHKGDPPAAAEVRARLGESAGAFTAQLHLDPADLRRRGCRTIRLAGHDVFEVCFQREGVWFHVYVAPAEAFPAAAVASGPEISRRGPYAVAVWRDSVNVYALASRAGTEALRRVL